MPNNPVNLVNPVQNVLVRQPLFFIGWRQKIVGPDFRNLRIFVQAIAEIAQLVEH